MKLSEEQIKKIVDILDCGMVCYINRETKEIKSMIDVDDFDGDIECWEEDIEEIAQNSEKYFKIKKMSSSESFQIMEAFIEQVSDKEFGASLTRALDKRKPFQNFKYELSSNLPEREKWFKFKAGKYAEWVKAYLSVLSDD